MGYLVTAHATKAMPSMAALSTLPPSIGWAIHHHSGEEAYFVDAFKAGRPQSWPFTSAPPTKDIPLELPPELEPLSALYKALEGAQLADAFKRGFLNLNLAISKALNLQVCSFCSDDDGLDFVVLSDSGRLSRLHCQCGDLEVFFEGGALIVQPLVVVDDGKRTDLSSIHAPESSIIVRDRNVEKEPLLHRVASEEVTRFFGLEKPPLGLGGSDEYPPPKIESSEKQQGKADSGPAPKKPWWKLW